MKVTQEDLAFMVTFGEKWEDWGSCLRVITAPEESLYSFHLILYPKWVVSLRLSHCCDRKVTTSPARSQ